MTRGWSCFAQGAPYRASAKQLCFFKDLPGPDRFFMKPRFEPDVPTNADPDLSASLIDPEAFDASEQQFAASLSQPLRGLNPDLV